MTEHRAAWLILALFLSPRPAVSEDFSEDWARSFGELLTAAAKTRPELRGRAADSREPFVLRVLSFNIWGLPSDDQSTHERYAKIGSILQARRNEGRAPHIVAIQEAFHPRTEELVSESGYPYYRYGAPATSHSPLRSGLVILSEFPIETAATIDYRQCVGWDCWANKGALHVRVAVPGLAAPLDVFNTHMNAGPDEPGPERDRVATVRMDQARQLFSFLRAARTPGAAMVFPGDFNFHGGWPDYDFFSSNSGLSNAAQGCASGANCTGSGDPGGIWRSSVDHQFFSSAPQAELVPIHLEQNFKEPVDGGPLSDHWGLEAHYRLTEKTR